MNIYCSLKINELFNISTCKNLNELNIYLDHLESNELDKFNLFEIKYEILQKNKIDIYLSILFF